MSSKGNAAEVQLYKDISSFYADPFAFVRYAYPWGKPGFLQNHEGPDKWQKEFLIELGEQVKQRAFDGFQPVAPVRMCVVSGHGVGKSVLAARLACIIHQRRIVSRTVVGSEGESRRRDRLGLGKARECSKRPERLVCDKAPPADAESE